MRASMLLQVAALACFSIPLSTTRAGQFHNDFNAGPPDSIKFLGTARWGAVGGFENTGVLRLTSAATNQVGSFLLPSLDRSHPVSSFLVTCKMLIGGGTGADGLSFVFLSQPPETAFGEMPTKAPGLCLSFNTYKPRIGIQPEFRVYLDGATVFEMPYPQARSSRFGDLLIKLDPDGTLDVVHEGRMLCQDLALGRVRIQRGRFGFGARTALRTDNHFIDDLRVRTSTSPGVYVDGFRPSDLQAEARPSIEMDLRDLGTGLDAGSVLLKLDGETVAPVVKENGADIKVLYRPEKPLAAGSRHLVELTFADKSRPPVTNEFWYSFGVRHGP